MSAGVLYLFLIALGLALWALSALLPSPGANRVSIVLAVVSFALAAILALVSGDLPVGMLGVNA